MRKASAAPIDAAPAEHPDAELFRLDQEMEEAHARMKRLERASSRADRKARKAVGPRPLHPTDWEAPPMPAHLKQQWDDALKQVLFVDVGAGNWEPAPVRAWRDEVKKERTRVEAAWDEYSAKLKELGYDAKEDVFNACVSDHDDFAKRICSIPAHTFEGMAVKLRAQSGLGARSRKRKCIWTITPSHRSPRTSNGSPERLCHDHRRPHHPASPGAAALAHGKPALRPRRGHHQALRGQSVLNPRRPLEKARHGSPWRAFSLRSGVPSSPCGQ
ncbi:MAG: hypothetical protein E5X67_26395 [Mesorhizobium sp.]|nr:MAG: hypothetical protein E5X67_26395 [Mesorhizobium sp.]